MRSNFKLGIGFGLTVIVLLIPALTMASDTQPLARSLPTNRAIGAHFLGENFIFLNQNDGDAIFDANMQKWLRNHDLTGNAIANNSITSIDIRNNSILTTDIKSGAVQGADLKDGSVVTAKLADGSVTKSKLAPGAAFRAYGRVENGALVAAASSGITVRPGLLGNYYCIQVAGVTDASLLAPSITGMANHTATIGADECQNVSEFSVVSERGFFTILVP